MTNLEMDQLVRFIKQLCSWAADALEQEHLGQQEIKRFLPEECSTCAFIAKLREAAKQ
jgi:hypothetical protein